MTLNLMNPLHARWLVELFKIMRTGQRKKLIITKWEASGISKAIKIGLPKLLSVNLFKDISNR